MPPVYSFSSRGCPEEALSEGYTPSVPLDQIINPCYIADLAEGRITREQAAELLGCFWLKTRKASVTIRKRPTCVMPRVRCCPIHHRWPEREGRRYHQRIKLFGSSGDGKMKLSEPAVYIRYHGGMKMILYFALECNLEYRGGNPAFLSDELGSRRFVDRGVSIEDASEWSASGCLAYHLDCSQHIGGFQHINQTKIFEITLYNGYDPRTKKQLGLTTGDVTKFTSVEELMEAYFKQEDYFVGQLNKDYEIRHSLDLEHPLVSALNAAYWWDYSIPSGMHPLKGGTPYPITTVMWIGERGTTDLADCFAAIKHVVFDTKKATMAELLEALKANWEGHEGLRQLCLKAPKYGNDDPYVDEMFEYIAKKNVEIMQSRPDPITGLKPFLFKGAAAGHIVHGAVLGALPNGRKAGMPVNDAGTSAMPGADVRPHGLVNSATKFDL